MSSTAPAVKRIRGFCALCVSRCGSIATVENGRFVDLDADPEHPTGKAFCIKELAAPELVYHPDRLLHPMRRTRPKGDSDPGWQRIRGTRRSRRPPSACRRWRVNTVPNRWRSRPSRHRRRQSSTQSTG